MQTRGRLYTVKKVSDIPSPAGKSLTNFPWTGIVELSVEGKSHVYLPAPLPLTPYPRPGKSYIFVYKCKLIMKT
jgi:hypothetical protein